MGLWTRILGRYLVGALAGLLLYAGLPPELVAMIRDDPEISAGVALAVASLIEMLTDQARKRGWKT